VLVADVPSGLLTVTSTAVPAVPAGGVAVIEVSELTVAVAETPPNCTVLSVVKPVPVIVTVALLPAAGPDAGLTPVTVGAAYENSSSNWPVSDGVSLAVTITSTVPDPGGDSVVISESETTKKTGWSFGPNVTSVAPVKPDPVIVTGVPPPAAPAVGLTLLTTGPAGCDGAAGP